MKRMWVSYGEWGGPDQKRVARGSHTFHFNVCGPFLSTSLQLDLIKIGMSDGTSCLHSEIHFKLAGSRAQINRQLPALNSITNAGIATEWKFGYAKVNHESASDTLRTHSLEGFSSAPATITPL
jgi:hypothetical protein